ncbi:MAG TPA: cytochrome c peroxidase [bacterium]|nr:cytochrome c peroxidase [bacterium]HMZ05097.1 cytochrome c peroxidase [bacterium]HNB09404.1 cytochrome c peroxidase [bacterium]HNB56524.1 cytochrome c peroxidase [bacterium]HNC48612.1 cytochrome c peroxidase [bacterium]
MIKKFGRAIQWISWGLLTFSFCQCGNSDETTLSKSYPAITAKFGQQIDVKNLANYEDQAIPTYITKDNTGLNTITNEKATVGRVLFYDKNLSFDNSISCAGCHHQSLAFGDTALASRGVQGGLTGRHSMRLVNSRFASETRFFWDERAISLEDQTTRPIKDHAEMGFSGESGRPGFDSLLIKLSAIDYYRELFDLAYGDETITEARLQECMGQFIRSIQSFDTRYDAGRAQVTSDLDNFPNFTTQENQGKTLFITPPVFNASGERTSGGLGCAGCHRAPEFDIDPNSGNNAIIGKLNADGFDVTNTRAPSLRDMTGPDGEPHTPMMHTGVITTLQAAIGHYGTITIGANNTLLDPRLKPNGFGQKLNLTSAEVNAVIAFLKTLSGTQVYTDARWSDPFGTQP